MEQAEALNFTEIASALSFALDLTEGAVPGHALRTTLLGMRIASALQIPAAHLADLFFSLQLKDVGCSSNAARVAQIFAGDDRAAKALSKLSDWSGLLSRGPADLSLRVRLQQIGAELKAVPRNFRALLVVVEAGEGRWRKLRRVSYLHRNAETNTRDAINCRCERGAEVLRKLQMSEAACSAVRALDERWDGSGYPDGLVGNNIPVLARVAAVAQSLDTFASNFGKKEAVQALKRRSGTCFDPEIVAAALQLHRQGTLWQDCEPGCSVETTRNAVLTFSPEGQMVLDSAQIDNICEAFAEVVDAKSPFTFRHSLHVTGIAVRLAEAVGLPDERIALVRRAALLHDLGKLGVSNTILDKPGRLTDVERWVVEQHPAATRTILSRISGFEEIARIAGKHHERLDGSGYPQGLVGKELSLESRLLALADVYAALSETRPYRASLPKEEVFRLLRKDVPHKLDADLVEVLESVADEQIDYPQVATHSCAWTGKDATVEGVQSVPAHAVGSQVRSRSAPPHHERGSNENLSFR